MQKLLQKLENERNALNGVLKEQEHRISSPPTVGNIYCQSSEKYFDNHRKIIVEFIIMVYNIDNVNENEVF